MTIRYGLTKCKGNKDKDDPDLEDEDDDEW